MIDPASFRDPCGFIVHEGNSVLRVINKMYEKEYSHLTKSGLSEILIKKDLMISYQEITTDKKYSVSQYKVVEAKKIQFISYPHEWCFSQLKDAALLTLKIDEIAVEYNMMLKDATAYNVQFDCGKAIFIDTLSFDLVEQNYEWKAYKQFCEFFLVPLCLMIYKDPRLSILLKDFINGIPLDLGVKLIPVRFLLKPSVFLHLFLQNKLQKSKAINNKINSKNIISKQQHKLLIAYLKYFIESMTLPKNHTEWDKYYSDFKEVNMIYLTFKEKLVEEFVRQLSPKIIWDIGANDGHFSRIASKYSTQVISIDKDWRSTEYNYNECKRNNIDNIYPIISDLVNQDGGFGWNNEERKPLFSRLKKPDLIIALALMHHIINENVPINKFLDLLRFSSEYVILEYIPKTDPNVVSMIKTRGLSWNYIEESEFQKLVISKFEILKTTPIGASNRSLYLLKVKQYIIK